MKGVVVTDAPEKSITKSDLFTPSVTHDHLAQLTRPVCATLVDLLTPSVTLDSLAQLTRPVCATLVEQMEAMERQRRQDWLDKISGKSAMLELADRMNTKAADSLKRAAMGSAVADLATKAPGTLYGFGSAADSLRRAALGSMAADLVGQPPVILSGLESASDAIKRAAMGTMSADLVGQAPGTLYGFGPAADALKRWEQEALNARAQRGPELVPLAPVPIRNMGAQPSPEPNHADVIAELESHQQQVLDRWMAVYDRERITSASDKEAASRAAHLIAKNEGENPGHVWTMIRQSLALRTHGEQATKQAISQRAADIARQKNAKERAWVLKEWESRTDLDQSKASFARQYVPLVKQRFGKRVTEDTIKHDWLPKTGK